MDSGTPPNNPLVGSRTPLVHFLGEIRHLRDEILKHVEGEIYSKVFIVNVLNSIQFNQYET